MIAYHNIMKKEKGEQLPSVDINEARAYLVEIVPKAGEILRRYFESGNFTSRSKGGVDFSTQADDEVDEFLREHLGKKYP